MKVILRQDVPDIGNAGDTIEVKAGYGRNFLIPRNLAVPATKANLKALHSAVNQFRMDTTRFPTEDEQLMALIEQPSDVEIWEPGGYLETTELPLDGWNNEFIYELYPESGKQFAIRSMGPDGEEGTEDDLLSTDAF